jgi:hypothetical protein
LNRCSQNTVRVFCQKYCNVCFTYPLSILFDPMCSFFFFSSLHQTLATRMTQCHPCTTSYDGVHAVTSKEKTTTHFPLSVVRRRRRRRRRRRPLHWSIAAAMRGSGGGGCARWLSFSGWTILSGIFGFSFALIHLFHAREKVKPKIYREIVEMPSSNASGRYVSDCRLADPYRPSLLPPARPKRPFSLKSPFSSPSTR